jgi:hypothetical protein
MGTSGQILQLGMKHPEHRASAREKETGGGISAVHPDEKVGFNNENQKRQNRTYESGKDSVGGQFYRAIRTNRSQTKHNNNSMKQRLINRL